MKRSRLFILALSLACLALFACAAQAGKKDAAPGDNPGMLSIQGAVAIVEIQSVDTAARTVTIKTEDGKVETHVLDPRIKDLDKLKPGDKVKIETISSLLVNLAGPGEKIVPGTQETVEFTTRGGKPAKYAVQTSVAELTVKSVNVKKRAVELVREDGEIKRFLVPKQVEGLEKLKKGDKLSVRFTQSMAVGVVKAN
jgi:hypothetical protein